MRLPLPRRSKSLSQHPWIDVARWVNARSNPPTLQFHFVHEVNPPHPNPTREKIS
jgi:hypothetical protein